MVVFHGEAALTLAYLSVSLNSFDPLVGMIWENRPMTDAPEALRKQTEDAASLVAAAGSVAVLTGAGISTDSGIPDFRGPQGVWTLNPGAERASNIHVYQCPGRHACTLALPATAPS